MASQERVSSGATEYFIEHKPVDCFIINVHALHNAHLVHRALPRDLTATKKRSCIENGSKSNMMRSRITVETAMQRPSCSCKEHGGADQLPTARARKPGARVLRDGLAESELEALKA